MVGFNFDTGGRRCIRPILEKYQAGKDRSYLRHHTCMNLKKLLAHPNKGESEGYTVKSKGANFTISNYPLEQTEFLYEQKQGMASSN